MSRSVGLFGCGTIGTEIARSVAEGRVDVEIRCVYDRNPEKRTRVLELFDDNQPIAVESPEELLDADMVIEAAGADAVETIAADALSSGCDCMILSAGAFADSALQARVFDAADAGSSTLFVPSGAIAGLDAVKAAAFTGELESVALTTTKPPTGLEGAPYLESERIDLEAIDEPTVVFEGSANEAAVGFPSNINVAMALSLAGIGSAKTTVRIVADPDEENNVHRITADGEMGSIETTVRNVPSPTNPKTSYLAAVSAIEKLRSLETAVSVGT